MREFAHEDSCRKWTELISFRYTRFVHVRFTHYSYAIRDAAELVKAPLIEVHLSNPLSREEFRHTSVISGVANGTIGGFGPNSYVLAIIALTNLVAR